MFYVAATALLMSCGGGGQGMPNFGDDEYPVETVGTQNASMINMQLAGGHCWILAPEGDTALVISEVIIEYVF